MATNKSGKLQTDYESKKPFAERFCSALVEQIKELTTQNNITLAVPIESRVKSWSSISDKIERITLNLTDILQLNDLVGIRLILLFRRDLDKCIKFIEENLEVIEKEDAATRLDESQFGYQSYHYVIKLPKGWLSIPTLKDFSEYKAEIQIRTIAQHIWAAASHNLQYKQEDNVPKTVRRSINRVSALLETVDLEFERVLTEREHYIKEFEAEVKDEILNVDSLKEILDTYLPLENRMITEDYSSLIRDLSKCGIKKSSELISLIKKHLKRAIKEDAEAAADMLKKYNTSQESDKIIDRVSKGYIRNHCGLIRTMLDFEFGGGWRFTDVSGSISTKSEVQGEAVIVKPKKKLKRKKKVKTKKKVKPNKSNENKPSNQ